MAGGKEAAAGGGGEVIYSNDGRLVKPMPLSAVVKDAVRRWYLEAERDAQRGDVVRVVGVPWCVVVVLVMEWGG